MDAAKPKRRWLRFSLQSLLLVVLLVAVFFGGRASMYSSLRRERQRTEAAERAERRERQRAEAAERAEMATKLEALLAAEIRGEIILPETNPR